MTDVPGDLPHSKHEPDHHPLEQPRTAQARTAPLPPAPPQQQYGDGGAPDGQRHGIRVPGKRDQPAHLPERTRGRAHVAHGVHLPGEHPLDDRHGHGPEPPPQPEHPELHHPGRAHEHTEHVQPVRARSLVHDHGQPTRWTAHPQAAPGQHPGDQPQLGGHTGGDSHAHTLPIKGAKESPTSHGPDREPESKEAVGVT